MKKLLSLATVGTLFLVNSASAYAEINTTSININPSPPSQGINPNANVQVVLGNVITIIFVIAILMVLFYLIIGAFQWITSGGEKEKVGKARGIIINAIIGLVILSFAFLITTVIGTVLHIDFHNLQLPALDKNA